MHKKLKNLFLILLLSSCTSAPSDVDFFLVGDGLLQYFFPSRRWTSAKDDNKLEADWLYRNYVLPEEDGGPRTLLNFSLYSKITTYRELPEEVVLSAGPVKITIPREHIKLIYLDRGKTRYSCWLLSTEMEAFMAAANTEAGISILLQEDLVFTSTRHFQAQIVYFQEVLLGIY